MTVGRFAPSPSGRMHLGNVFTALLAWLSVRSKGGRMVLRIEDLDPQRSKPEFISALRDDLRWLGLDWDEEMPLQSTRGEIYAAYFNSLPVYPCYCSRNEIHIAAAPHATDGKWIYPGTCRQKSEQERRREKKSPSWRVPVPEKEIVFVDGVFGEYRENLAQDCGDFILRRADGVFAYQLAVVCDDALGGVTEVVRGCDLLDSTPRQIWLYETLGFPVPEFYHVPLLVAPDGKRLSKREKSLDMSQLRERYTPEELVGKLAQVVGLTSKADPLTPSELLRHFEWNKIGKENIVISPELW